MGSYLIIMDPLHKVLVLLVILFVGCIFESSRASSVPSFDQNYHVTWGYDHVIPHGSKVQIYMDQEGGGAGFESWSSYGSGFFEMKIKVPGKDSGGVVTAFYLKSIGDNHDELDFEFLGNREGKPYALQTNVFANGQGNREHRVQLWFDPRDDFHAYKILWNHRQIVFYVDDIPIRYFKNNEDIGVSYPSKPMKIEASIWDGSSWATDGGLTKVDWNHAPFRANFEGFDISGCPMNDGDTDMKPCYSNKSYWWNRKWFWQLNETEMKAYEIVKQHFVTYDYCLDKIRYPFEPPPECSTQ